MYAITVRDIKNYFIAYLFDKWKSDITVNGQIKTMKQFLKYLYEEGWLNQNIDEELHVVKAEKLMLQTFTKEQVAALLEQSVENVYRLRNFTIMRHYGDRHASQRVMP